MPQKLQPNPSGQWPGGMNNRDDVNSLKFDFVRDAQNGDFDRLGRFKMRPGYRKVMDGSCHSLWHHASGFFGIMVKDGYLGTFQPEGSLFNPLLSVDPALPMSYCFHNDFVYYSNTEVQGVINSYGAIHPWGIDTPPHQPALSLFTFGGFPAGRYQLATTWLRRNGEESGALGAALVDVTEGMGITMAGIPQPDDGTVVRLRAYVSPPGGDALYHMADIAIGVTTYNLQYNRLQGRMLDTQFMDRVPCGQIVRSFNGRVYVAAGRVLYYTDPLRYGLYSIKNNYFQFPDEITMVEVVEDGLFVATHTRTYFLSGNDPKTFVQRIVDLFGVVPGSSGEFRGADFGKDAYQGRVAVWWSKSGCLIKGQIEGIVEALTEGRLSVPRYRRGAIMYRERGGMKHIISSMFGPENAGFGAVDRAVAQVIRNGVEI